MDLEDTTVADYREKTLAGQLFSMDKYYRSV
jgi:hypothetical protein